MDVIARVGEKRNFEDGWIEAKAKEKGWQGFLKRIKGKNIFFYEEFLGICLFRTIWSIPILIVIGFGITICRKEMYVFLLQYC
jgi:hypothetical protein